MIGLITVIEQAQLTENRGLRRADWINAWALPVGLESRSQSDTDLP